MTDPLTFTTWSQRTNSVQTRTFLMGERPKVVIDYLRASHWRYEHETIPKIEQNFLGLLKLFPMVPSLPVIFNLFLKFQLSIQVHMKLEEQTIYSAFLKGEGCNRSEEIGAHSHEEQEPFLIEIIRMLRKEKCSENPFCSLLIQRLTQFEFELREHAWIEEHIVMKQLMNTKPL